MSLVRTPQDALFSHNNHNKPHACGRVDGLGRGGGEINSLNTLHVDGNLRRESVHDVVAFSTESRWQHWQSSCCSMFESFVLLFG